MSEAEATAKPVEETKVEAATDEPQLDTANEEQKPAESGEAAPSAASEEKKESESGDKSSGSMLKTKGKIDFDNHRNNRKFDPTTREVTDDPAAIRKQVRDSRDPQRAEVADLRS